MLLLESLKYRINNHKVISFDIFDTLLLRPYVKPTDVFLHIEKLTNRTNFFDNRIKAEQKARQTCKEQEDITLDDIYNEIDDKYKYIKQIEIDLETQTLQQNKEMFEVFEYAKQQDKKVIITSDMYLDKNILSNILNLKGYRNYYKIYVSSEIKKCKATGNLYKHIIEDLQVEAKDILHIGDNYQSDVEKAKKNGIDTVFYEKISNKFFNETCNKKFKVLLNENPNNLDISIILGMIILNNHNKENKNILNYWEDFGYNFGGPICYGFTEFVLQEAKKRCISDLFFVARDGYTLDKVYNIIKGNCNTKSHYIYAPRILKILCLLDYEGNEDYIDILFKIFIETSEKYEKLFNKPLNSFWEKEQFFRDNVEYFKEFANDKSKEYLNYLNSLKLNGDNIWMVDSITIKFSAQQLLNKMINKNVSAIYYQNNVLINLQNYHYDPTCILEDSTFVNYKQNSTEELLNWDTMELIMTAPELPIKNIINGEVTYQDDPKLYEILRKELYKEIYKSEIKFSKDIMKIFGNFNVGFTYTNISKLMNSFYTNLNDIDKQYFSKIYHSSGSDHIYYTSLLELIKGNYGHTSKISKIKLFNRIQLLTIKNKNNRINYKLFNFIPLLRIKKKNNVSYCKLFNFIPFLKVKDKEHKGKYVKLFNIIPLFKIK